MVASLAALSLLGPAFLNSNVQQMNCFPKDTTSTDRVVISLNLPANSRDLPESGTLYLSSGIDSDGSQDNSGVLKLEHVPERDEDAAKGLVRYEARNTVSIFDVVLAEKNIGKTLKDLDLSVELERVTDHYKVVQDVTCYSTVFAE